MKPDELRNWILFISAISAIVIGVAHYLKNIAYESMDYLFFGLPDDNKRDTIKIVFVFILFSFFASAMVFNLISSNEVSNKHSSTTVWMLYIYMLILTAYFIKEILLLDKVILKLIANKNEKIKYKKWYQIFYIALIIVSAIVIGTSFTNMIANINVNPDDSIIILIMDLLIFLYTIVIYGTNKLKLDLSCLKKSIIYFTNENKENLICKIYKIKGDFIYYVEDDKVKCINKSSVSDIYELKKNKDLYKKNSNTFIECDEHFNNIKKDLNKEDKKLEDIANLYNNIKDYYIEKIKTNNNFIIYEKLRLEGELGKYTKNIFNLNLNMGVIILTVLVTLFLESTKVFDIINITQFHYVINIILNTIIRMSTFFILLFGCLYNLKDKNSEQEKNEEVLNNIRLKVLENIEKEIQEKDKIENVAIQNINNEVLKEVSATDNKDSNRLIKKGIIGKFLKKK